MSIPGYTVYRYFLATKIHFTTESYNVIKSSGNISATEESYTNRSDQSVFEKIGKRYKTDKEVVQFLIANFAYGNSYVVYSTESHRNYVEWKRRKESITQVVSNDLINTSYLLEDDRQSNPIAIVNGLPPLLKYYIGNHVTYETMVILQDMLDFLPLWEANVLMWQDLFLRIRKGKQFVRYDPPRIEKLLKDSDISFTVA